MSNVKFAVLCIVLCLVGLCAYQFGRNPQQELIVKTLQSQVKQDAAAAKVNNTVASTRNRAVAASNQRKVVQDARTEIALQAHAEWASKPVPDDVIDAIRLCGPDYDPCN